MTISIGGVAPHHSLLDCVFGVRLSGVDCHYLVFLLILLSKSYFLLWLQVLLTFLFHGYPIWTTDLGFWNEVILVLQSLTS